MTPKVRPSRNQVTSKNARIVFDLDGTLIDSAPDIQGIANAGLEKIGFAPITLEETHQFIGAGIQSFIEQVRKARGVPDRYQEPLLKDLTARYDTAVELTVMYPGVPEALATLAQSHQLGICTNKLYKPCISVLKHLKIDQFFQTVWGGDNALARKPDPAPLQAAFDDLGTGSRIFVGDSEIDAETARRAEVPFILFTQGYRNMPIEKIPHNVALNKFSDLNKEIEALLQTL
ncbi:HAD-IA family hydrolase [Alphaproteobacteria bacterium]|nr:HAD-IA family hydrolase [Alphaproteobacteria bacterium]